LADAHGVTLTRRAVAKGAVAEALQAIETAALSLEFRSKPLDAKTERLVLQKAKEELHKELNSCDAADASATMVLGTCLAAAMFRRYGPLTAVLFAVLQSCRTQNNRAAA
jgi:hypothetical protein